MTTMTNFTINDIKRMVRASGSHWFDPDTMKTFGTHVFPTVYQGNGGIYFVTSEDNFDRTSKEYTCRKFTGSSIDTMGRYEGKDAAVEQAKELAGEGHTEVRERFTALLPPGVRPEGRGANLARPGW